MQPPRPGVLALVLLSATLAPGHAWAQLDQVIRFNGYSSFEFERLLGDEGRGDPNGSFDADLFDLVINATPSDRLRVAADLTWEHGAATEDGRGNVAVEYAFAEYVVQDWLKLRAGKMFTHFGIYNEIHTAKPAFLTVKEPQATNKNDRFGSDLRFYPRWGTGLALAGSVDLADDNLEYIVQLTNGEQEQTNPYEEDDNAAKAISARVRYQASPRLTLGASVYTDRLTEFDDEGAPLASRTRLLSYGAELIWQPSRFGLELEVVAGDVDPSAGDTTSRWAMTALASYRLGEKVTPYFRYEYLDPDTGQPDDTASLFVYGLNFRVGGGLYFKVELDTVDAGAANHRFEGQGYTEVKAAMVVGF
jgi:predicted porin